MKTPHKHAELIKAWADGAEIEEQHLKKSWAPFTDGHWMESDSWNYRIKPEAKPKPDVVTLDCVQLEGSEAFFIIEDPNLKLIWCGETGKLKSAEVL